MQQLVNSEFTWKQIREIVVSSLLGHVRREKRRKRLNKPRYRSGVESLEARIEKKLVERYNWFRQKRKPEEYVHEDAEKEDTKDIHKKDTDDKSETVKDNEMPKSILFVQHTKDSILAKDIRRIIQELKPCWREA